MFCQYCGGTIVLPERARFCGKCGQSVGNRKAPLLKQIKAHSPYAANTAVEMDENAPGKNFLKICGIICIVMGSLGFLSALFLFAAVGVVGGVAGTALGMFGFGGLIADVRTLAIFTLFLSPYAVYVGIMGIIHCKRLDKGTFLIILMGIIVGSTLLFHLVTAFRMFTITSIVGYVPYALFLLGGIKNRNAYFGL